MDVIITPQIELLIRAALEEDIGAGDLTTLSFFVHAYLPRQIITPLTVRTTASSPL